MPVIPGTKTTFQLDKNIMDRYQKSMERRQKREGLRKLVKQDYLVMLLDQEDQRIKASK